LIENLRLVLLLLYSSLWLHVLFLLVHLLAVVLLNYGYESLLLLEQVKLLAQHLILFPKQANFIVLVFILIHFGLFYLIKLRRKGDVFISLGLRKLTLLLGVRI